MVLCKALQHTFSDTQRPDGRVFQEGMSVVPPEYFSLFVGICSPYVQVQKADAGARRAGYCEDLRL